MNYIEENSVCSFKTAIRFKRKKHLLNVNLIVMHKKHFNISFSASFSTSTISCQLYCTTTSNALLVPSSSAFLNLDLLITTTASSYNPALDINSMYCSSCLQVSLHSSYPPQLSQRVEAHSLQPFSSPTSHHRLADLTHAL